MNRRYADPRMAGIRVVEPVVMEGSIELRRFSQTDQRGFSRIPVMIVGNGDIG
ncbi:hypothetical protein D3C76_1496020 [compost metagenome]